MSEANAWLTIDNGDQKVLLNPGDTVNILPGTYITSTTIQLITDGTAENPIIYRNYGPVRALIDADNQSNIIMVMEGDHVVIDGLELTNSSDQGIHNKSDSCIITNCYIHHTDKECVLVEGSYNLFLRNITAFSTNEEGFKNEGGGEYNRYYNNTVYGNAKMGFELKEKTARVFNNIVALNEKGINGDDENICAYNNVWNNTNGDYEAGVFDSAGGISVEPQFADPANGHFYLLPTASEVDAGLDLGYYFSQTAPDMGGVEMFNVYYVSTTGDDDNDGLTEENAWWWLDNGDTKELLIPGDSIKVLPGTYSIPNYNWLKTSGLAGLPITYCKWGEENAVFDVGGLSVTVLYLNADHVKVDGLELTNSGHSGIYLEGDSCIVTNCFIHDNAWDGIYIYGNYNLILKNLIVDNSESGIENDNTSEYNSIYGNTVYGCTIGGIYIQPGITSARIFSNIVVASNLGINAVALNVCGFNDIWNNSTSNYFGGAVDSAGGISANPLFINPADNEFHLKTGSPAVNTGLDLGYPYNESAPEMGAFEYGLPGDLNYIEVAPESTLILTGQTLQYSAYGYDINDSLISDLTERVNWSTDDPTSSITATGLYTAGNNPNTYHNAAVYGLLADTGLVQVTAVLSYIEIELFDGTPFGDTTLSTDNDTTVLYCRGYNNSDSLLGDIAVEWSILGDSIGSVTDETSTSTILTLTKTGFGQVYANAGTKKDSTGVITCEGGEPYRYEVEPETATVSTDSTIQFNAQSLDLDGNISSPSVVPSWEIIGGIGTISFSGLFNATKVGEGYLVAYHDGIIPDTVGPITVTAGEIVRIEITPDVAAVRLGDSINFTAVGYDTDDNPVDAGEITWHLLGRVGDIDSTGLFIADRPGTGRVTAVSSINDITDSSGYIEVEELYVSTVPQGMSFARPHQDALAILTFRIDNYFSEDKTITGLTLRDASRGTGLEADRLGNIDSIAVYLDVDADSTLTVADSLIAEDEYNAAVISLSFSPLTVPADEGRTFIVSVNTALYARDSDSLDIFILPATDVAIGDATVPAGPDTVNSLGYVVIDGLVAAQLNVVSTGADTVRPADSIYPVLAVDLPRNGYSEDSLKIISIVNVGTAGQNDLDSLVLYRDDGDDVWGGTAIETRLGRLAYTGSYWTLSGLAVPLSDPTQRFYVGAALSGYPRNGATVALSIPVNGIDMASHNDGPLDEPLLPVDTIVIQTTEAMVIEEVPIDAGVLIPGESSGALLSFELTNSYADTIGLDSLRCSLIAADPDGASQEQLDSQVDSVLLYVYLNRTSNLLDFGPDDTVLAAAVPDNGTVLFRTEGFDISGNGGVVGFSIIAYLNAQNCKDRNTVGFTVVENSDIFFDQPVTVSGEFPVQNDETFIIDAFPAVNISVNPLLELTHFGGQVNRAVLDFVLPGNGYADDELERLQLVNISSFEDVRAIKDMNLWADLTGDGFSDDDSLLGRFVALNDIWEIIGLDYPIPSGGARFIVTVNVSLEQFKAGTMLLQIPVDGVRYHSEMSGPDNIAVSSPQTHLIFPSNRVTVISIPKPVGVIYPASNDNLILTFALYNSYLTQNQILQALNFTNVSYTRSSPAYADYELGQVSLYFDADKNRVWGNDSLIGTGYFTDGKLQLTGLDISLPPESLSYFFVTVDVPTAMIDSDSLMVAIAGSTDFVFSGSVNVNGDLPLTRGAFLAVDGSVREQYYLHHLTPRTVSPGDTSITLLAFQPARNGNQTDTLTRVTVANHDDADTSDIASLELWLDSNGDTVWQETDSLLGTFSYADSVWTVNGFEMEISGEPPTLFVLGDIAPDATPNVSFRGKIPVNGCLYESDNDGPLDGILLSNSIFPVSTSSLRITSAKLDETYSVGQDIEVRFTVTNILTAPIDNIVGRMVTVSNPAIVTLSDSLVGPVTLAGGESTDFYFIYTADQPGLVAWQVRALALDLPDSSVIIQTDTVRIQAAPENMKVQLINTIPASITKGQENVFPMNLRFIHPDTLGTAASVRIDSLAVTIEDGSGGMLNADEAFSRMVLSSGYSIITVLETIPHQSRLTLVFSEPVV
ncbi:MAG: right-handed parallel beta-helix repeat-containing protein, partial [candidate division Zixibacteria bacterium]|nr:right-handed parallel beta-helix repeat-containing protein [candidate division Zixibacteria bacterium]